MSLDRGMKPSVSEFKERVSSRNLDNLTIWHNVGRDVDNGEWAIYGARYGTWMTMLQDWDPRNVQWFDNIKTLWDMVKDNNPTASANHIGEELEAKLNLPMLQMNSEQSKFFKRHYKTDFRNKGPLVTEMEVIRQIEGW
jgi:hypothetical protein